MKLRKEDIEIMAPVGSYESLRAAIQGGADSVYFGVEHLNMRAKSTSNFAFDDLHEISRICKEHNIRSYLALNIVLYDHDLKVMRNIIDQAKSIGISAIIATDHAVINYANEAGMEVHLSTQVNISNMESVKFYSTYADVMILARELSLTQVKHIAEQITEQNITGPSGNLVELEIFTHGALCMAISGKCYLSLHEYNSSANRGACLQSCRRSYTVTDNETGYQLEIDNEYIMSPKDLSTIGIVDKIIDAGVKVFKIEGRARSPEYVKTVSECYREAANAVIEGNYTAENIRKWENRLKTVFNRGFWEGYYLGRKTGEWAKKYGSQATRKREYIGQNKNYYAKIQVAEFQIDAGTLAIGDQILITGPNTGVIETQVTEIHNDDGPVSSAQKGDRISVPVNTRVRRADKLYKLVKNPNVE